MLWARTRTEIELDDVGVTDHIGRRIYGCDPAS